MRIAPLLHYEYPGAREAAAELRAELARFEHLPKRNLILLVLYSDLLEMLVVAIAEYERRAPEDRAWVRPAPADARPLAEVLAHYNDELAYYLPIFARRREQRDNSESTGA